MTTRRVMKDKELVELCDEAVRKYKGNAHELERAIGSLFLGRQMGWKVLYLIHDRKTVRKYAEILGVDFREVLPEETEYSRKSMAWKLAQKLENFWKAVKREIPGMNTPEMT